MDSADHMGSDGHRSTSTGAGVQQLGNVDSRSNVGEDDRQKNETMSSTNQHDPQIHPEQCQVVNQTFLNTGEYSDNK